MKLRSILAGIVLATLRLAAQQTCTCPNGRSIETGVVSYSRNSDRDAVIRVEADRVIPSRPCQAVWTRRTEIHVVGSPYHFHLERMPLRDREVEGCSPVLDRFVKRDKTYQFVFDANSSSIREMRPVEDPPPSPGADPGPDPQSESNANLWNSITLDIFRRPSSGHQAGAAYFDPTREFNRTSWVLARKEIRGHYVGIVDEPGSSGRLVQLKKGCRITAGQLGQIEAVSGGKAIVRFYGGSRAERFSAKKNAIRRWYDKTGGPYEETQDDLFTAIRADIVEVSLDDLVEVNDYMDQQRSDRT